MKKIILLLLLIAGLGVRLYKIDSPLADWHSWRQADTASVARHFIKDGYSFLYPKFDDLSSAASGMENPQGHRFVEFPIFNAAHALLFQTIESFKSNWLSFETVGRLISVFSSLLGAIFLYLIVKKILGYWLGITTMGFFLFLPFNIFYSRTVLPGQMMTFLTLASIFYLIESKDANSQFKKILSLILAMAAILVKPYAVFLLIPSWLVIFRERVNRKKVISFLIYGLVAAAPFLVWRLWIKQFPEGIPASSWLFNKEGIRLRPAWWRWLFAERLGKLILGHWGLVPFVIGLVIKSKKKGESLFLSWLVGIFAYLVIFAGGNVTHDYYQMIAIPVISVFLAKGTWFLIKAPKTYFNKNLSFLLVIFSCLAGLAFSWYQVKEYYKINHPDIIEAGRAADKILPQEAKVIAPYNGDMAFLYQINRQGWPIVTRSLKETVQLGATHYVSVNFDSMANEVIDKCQVIEENDRWVIVDLGPCREELLR